MSCKFCIQQTRMLADGSERLAFHWLQSRPTFPDEGEIEGVEWTPNLNEAFDFGCMVSATPEDAASWGSSDWASHVNGTPVIVGTPPVVRIGQTKEEEEEARVAAREAMQTAMKKARAAAAQAAMEAELQELAEKMARELEEEGS